MQDYQLRCFHKPWHQTSAAAFLVCWDLPWPLFVLFVCHSYPMIPLLSIPPEFARTDRQRPVIGDFLHKRQLGQEEELDVGIPVSEICKEDS